MFRSESSVKSHKLDGISYLIYDIGTKDGLLHVFLVQLDDTFDVVDNLLDIRR